MPCGDGRYSSTTPWALSLAVSDAESTSCTALFPLIAIVAATPAACPRIMYCGSIRTDEYATWLAENATGTSRFVTSARYGRRMR